MRLLLAGMFVIWLVSPAAAADISGKWAGRVELNSSGGGGESGDAYAEFKQSGTAITGAVGPNETERVAIENGKLVGNKLTFQVSLPGDSGPRIFKLNLVVVDAGRIEGEIEGVDNDGGKLTGKISFARKTT